MHLNIFLLGLIAITCNIIGHKSEEYNSTTYIDEIEILKKIFINLNELKSKLDVCNQSPSNNLASTPNDSPIFDIRFDNFPDNCKTNVMPKNCDEATSCTRRSGIYKILIEKFSPEPFLVECDANIEGGGWLLIQRRQDGSVDFYRNWNDYQKGFGNIQGEFFIGLDRLHALTNYNGPQEILIILEHNNEIKHAKYNNFIVGNESDQYALQNLGAYTGDAGDSLSFHLGRKFSTKDHDNDESTCAEIYTGAWWYKKCHESNLNGKYGDNTHAKGVTWKTFRGYNISIGHVKMMIRRRRG
ncbi:ficolin-2-like [Cochliomyia hominivorax]